MGLIHITDVRRRRHGSYDNPANSHRQSIAHYTVPDGNGNVIKVCKQTFMDIFKVTKKQIDGFIKRKKNGETT